MRLIVACESDHQEDSIILVDYGNAVRGEKRFSGAEAMLEAGPTRLRPILLTNAATMMAAVPLALNLCAGSEPRGPMAIAVLAGLALSTLLSLLLVPAFYVVSDRIKGRITGKSALPVETLPQAPHAA